MQGGHLGGSIPPAPTTGVSMEDQQITKRFVGGGFVTGVSHGEITISMDRDADGFLIDPPSYVTADKMVSEQGRKFEKSDRVYIYYVRGPSYGLHGAWLISKGKSANVVE